MVFTLNTIEKITFDCQQINFDSSINENELVSMLSKINDFSNELQTITVGLKDLSYSNKICALKYCLCNDNIMHPQFLLNLINIIKNYNNLTDEFFNNEKVIFKDLEEFLNIKLELKDEIQDFIDSFSLNYFSMFMSIHKIESNFLDNIKELPKTYLNIIRALDFVTLSGICAKCKKLEKPNFYIANAIDIVSELSEKMNGTNEIMKVLIDNLKMKVQNACNS